MVGFVITGVAGIAAVGFVLFVVYSQPRPVWRDAAEHSRAFWLWWGVISVAVGLIPAIAGLWDGWVAAVWLAFWCAFAALQPALHADVLEVRRDIARRRRSTLAKRARSRGPVRSSDADAHR